MKGEFYMPKVILHIDGSIVEQEVKENANLVVLAGIRQFPKLKVWMRNGAVYKMHLSSGKRCRRIGTTELEGSKNARVKK